MHRHVGQLAKLKEEVDEIHEMLMRAYRAISSTHDTIERTRSVLDHVHRARPVPRPLALAEGLIVTSYKAGRAMGCCVIGAAFGLAIVVAVAYSIR